MYLVSDVVPGAEMGRGAEQSRWRVTSGTDEYGIVTHHLNENDGEGAPYRRRGRQNLLFPCRSLVRNE